MLIDTHTHLFAKEFDEDRKETVQRALDAGIDKLFLPNIDIQTIAPMMQMVADFPEHCYPMLGLHPSHIGADYENDLNTIDSLLDRNTFCAVGEIGIDLYWSQEFKQEQIQAFIWQIELAKKHQLPIVIHARNSFDEIFEVIDQLHDADLRGIFHSFTGNEAQAARIVEWGFLLGINGIVTFKNSGLDKVVATIPLENLVLETDSPYLAPTPHRGKRNESAFLVQIAQKVADIYQISLKELALVTTKNALNLFKI